MKASTLAALAVCFALLSIIPLSFAAEFAAGTTSTITSKATPAAAVQKQVGSIKAIRKADTSWKDAKIGFNNTTRTFSVAISGYTVNNSTGQLYKTGITNNTSVAVNYAGNAAGAYNLVLVTGPFKTGTTSGSAATLKKGEEVPIAVQANKNYVTRKWEVLMGDCMVKNPYAPVTEVVIASTDKKTCVLEAQLGNVINKYTGSATSGQTGGTTTTGAIGGGAACTAAQPVCPDGTTLEITSDQFNCPLYNCKTTGGSDPCSAKPACPPGSELVELPSTAAATACPQYECRKKVCPIASTAAAGVDIWEDCSLFASVKPTDRWLDEIGCYHQCLPTKKVCTATQPILEDCSIRMSAIPPEPWLDENNCLHQCKKTSTCAAASEPVLVECGVVATAASWFNQKSGCWEACKPTPVCPIDGTIADIDCGVTSTGVADVVTEYIDSQGCTHVCKPKAVTCKLQQPIYDIDCSMLANPAGTTSYIDSNGCKHACQIDCSGVLRVCPPGQELVRDSAANTCVCKATSADCSLLDRVCPAGQSLVNDPANPLQCICMPPTDCSLLDRVCPPGYQLGNDEQNPLMCVCKPGVCPVKGDIADIDCGAVSVSTAPTYIDPQGCRHVCKTVAVCPRISPIYDIDCSNPAVDQVPRYIDSQGCEHLCKLVTTCAKASPTDVTSVDCSLFDRIPTTQPWLGDDGCYYKCADAAKACVSDTLIPVDCSMYGRIMPQTWEENGCTYACIGSAKVCPNKQDPTYLDCGPSITTPSYVDENGCEYICNKQVSCPVDTVKLVDCTAEKAPWIGDDGCTYACKQATCASAAVTYVECAADVKPGYTWTDSVGCQFGCRQQPVCASDTPAVKTDCPAKSASSYVDPLTGCTVICQNIVEKPAVNVTNTSKPDLVISSISMPSQVVVNVRVYGSITTMNIGNGTAGNSTTSYYINGAMVNSIAVPGLAPGASSTGSMSFVCLREGAYTFTARADSWEAVAEISEANNARDAGFTCGLTKTAQTAPAADSITASMADTSGNLYAKVMGILGVYVEAYQK